MDSGIPLDQNSSSDPAFDRRKKGSLGKFALIRAMIHSVAGHESLGTGELPIRC